MSTVHVFINANGVFIKKTMDYVENIAPKKHFYFVQQGAVEGIPEAQLLTSRIQIETLIQAGSIDQVLFHSLHYFQFRWLLHLKRSYSNLKLSWMFWSFEYYQMSFAVGRMYAPFSRQFLTRKLLFNIWENLEHFVKGNSLTILPISKKKYLHVVNQVDQFCSFNSMDFEYVYGNDTKVKYLFMPYLDESDLFVQNDTVIQKNRIMVGHNGSPLLNHMETLAYLNTCSIQQEIILPLNYGKAEYIQKLKAELKTFEHLTIDTLDEPMAMTDYYAYVSDVEYFLLNSYCQQGLGNIIYFLFNHSTVYLSAKSSSYHYFRKLGFCLKSIEQLMSGERLSPISDEEKSINRIRVLEHFKREKVLLQWEKMLKD